MTPLRVGLLVPVLLASSACKESAAEDHGVVKIELRKAGGEDNPYAGTAEVLVRLTYTECLEAFYKSQHTEYTPTGPKGGPIFQEWAERLCDPDDAGDVPIPDCSVVDISQDLGDSSSTLRVRYAINNTDLDLKVFRFGPLPAESITEDCQPEVQLDQGSLLGFDASNVPIWGIESFTPFNTAVTGQPGEMWAQIAAM